MFETTKFWTLASAASAFLSSKEPSDSRRDIWAEAGHSIELAHCGPESIGAAARASVAIALIVAVKLCTVALLW
jgi:hypothetical protein